MKRLRAILDLSRGVVKKRARKSVSASARALKDAFARQRDAFVIATLNSTLNGRRRPASPAPAPSPEEVSRARARLKVRLKDAAALLRLISQLELDGITWANVFESYARTYRDGRECMKACRRDPTPLRLHKWRRPVKEFFFQSQALGALSGMRRRSRLARRLGDRLGEFNDLIMLEKRTAARAKKGLARRIKKRQAALRKVAMKIGTKLFAEKPRDMAAELDNCLKHTPRALDQCFRQI
jgi:hypothetical protein